MLVMKLNMDIHKRDRRGIIFAFLPRETTYCVGFETSIQTNMQIPNHLQAAF